MISKNRPFKSLFHYLKLSNILQYFIYYFLSLIFFFTNLTVSVTTFGIKESPNIISICSFVIILNLNISLTGVINITPNVKDILNITENNNNLFLNIPL